MEIYEDGNVIGTLERTTDGLYTEFVCKIKPSGKVKRVYLAYPYGVKYLGLPDRDGCFKTRIATKTIPHDCYATAGCDDKGEWRPWRGWIDEIWIESALICDACIAIPASEAMKFPAWDLEQKEIYEIQMALLPLNEKGAPSPREREAATNETLDFDDFTVGNFDDLPADDCIGSEGWKAHCPDL